MFKLNPINSYDISVNLTLNQEDKSEVSFTSNVPSTLGSFLFRLKKVGNSVIADLKYQNNGRRLEVIPALMFGHYTNYLPLQDFMSFNLDNALQQLKFATNEIEGGNFELEIRDFKRYLNVIKLFNFSPAARGIAPDLGYFTENERDLDDIDW